MLNFAIRFLQSDTFVGHTDKHIYLTHISNVYIVFIVITDCRLQVKEIINKKQK